jgi:uncharacterized membrane protein
MIWFARSHLERSLFADVDLGGIILALVLIPFGWLIRAWRYKVIIDASGLAPTPLSLRTSTSAFAVFLAGNAALPLRGGEWLRIGYLKRNR